MRAASLRFMCLSVISLIVIGCGGSERRKEGLDQLKKLQAATHGLHILVSAGITKQEYSQRLEDALLAVGDLDQATKEIVPKFPKKEQETVSEILKHIGKSIDAHKDAREYFGDKFTGPGCEDGCSLLTQDAYAEEKAKFPALAELKPDTVWHSMYPDSPPDYYRRDMLKALWGVALAEDDSAQELISQLQR